MADLPPNPGSNPDTDDSGVVGLHATPPSTPRWVYIFGIIALVLILLVGILVFTSIGGEHGPGRHMRSGAPGSRTPPIVQNSHQP